MDQGIIEGRCLFGNDYGWATVVIRVALFLLLAYWLFVYGSSRLARALVKVWDRLMRTDDGSNQV